MLSAFQESASSHYGLPIDISRWEQFAKTVTEERCWHFVSVQVLDDVGEALTFVKVPSRAFLRFPIRRKRKITHRTLISFIVIFARSMSEEDEWWGEKNKVQEGNRMRRRSWIKERWQNKHNLVAILQRLAAWKRLLYCCRQLPEVQKAFCCWSYIKRYKVFSTNRRLNNDDTV